MTNAAVGQKNAHETFRSYWEASIGKRRYDVTAWLALQGRLGRAEDAHEERHLIRSARRLYMDHALPCMYSETIDIDLTKWQQLWCSWIFVVPGMQICYSGSKVPVVCHREVAQDVVGCLRARTEAKGGWETTDKLFLVHTPTGCGFNLSRGVASPHTTERQLILLRSELEEFMTDISHPFTAAHPLRGSSE